KVLDLFSGCGGLSFGFTNQGYNVVAGIDNWNEALATFEYNHPKAKSLLMDLGNFDPNVILNTVGNIDIIIGGPPCQGFSISGKRNPDDPRNNLYTGFVKSGERLKPQAFVLENVPNLISMEKGKIKEQICKDFQSLGYDVKYKILLASDYGVPQNRKRVFFVGILQQNNFRFPISFYASSEEKITSFEALSDLPEDSVEDGT